MSCPPWTCRQLHQALPTLLSRSRPRTARRGLPMGSTQPQRQVRLATSQKSPSHQLFEALSASDDLLRLRARQVQKSLPGRHKLRLYPGSTRLEGRPTTPRCCSRRSCWWQMPPPRQRPQNGPIRCCVSRQRALETAGRRLDPNGNRWVASPRRFMRRCIVRSSSCRPARLAWSRSWSRSRPGVGQASAAT